jgi:hypothetical protein
MANTKTIAARNRGPQDLSSPQAVVKARVVANYGDPGLTEQYYFDILSRFVIAMVEPVGRVPTYYNKYRLFVLVRRPRELWVDVDAGVAADATSQIRKDIDGNISVGPVGDFSIDNISKINRPYSLGEEITIKKINEPIYGHESFFRSEFEDSYFTATKAKYNDSSLTRDPSGPQSVYGNQANWDIAKTFPLFPVRGGNSLYLNGFFVSNMLHTMKYNPSFILESSSLTRNSSLLSVTDPEFRYAIGLKKHQFETFWRYYHSADVSDYDAIINDWKVGNYRNDYLWNNIREDRFKASAVAWNNCVWEDSNTDAKTRGADNECQPLVVATPNTFPTPKTRAAGSFKFDPTYTNIIVQS